MASQPFFVRIFYVIETSGHHFRAAPPNRDEEWAIKTSKKIIKQIEQGVQLGVWQRLTTRAMQAKDIDEAIQRNLDRAASRAWHERDDRLHRLLASTPEKASLTEQIIRLAAATNEATCYEQIGTLDAMTARLATLISAPANQPQDKAPGRAYSTEPAVETTPQPPPQNVIRLEEYRQKYRRS